MGGKTCTGGSVLRKPPWLKKSLHLKGVLPMKERLRSLGLHTVCEEAHCPNLTECFSKKIATLMIMGDICTRACKFCAVATGRPRPLDPCEPKNVALWAKEIGFRHLVITSVDRDDLPDLGSAHFAETIRQLRVLNPSTTLEVLTPDFQGKPECLQRVCESQPQIYNHNLETVERLTPSVRSASKYHRSLFVLDWVKKKYPHQMTKSGLMLGLGETRKEVIKTMEDLCLIGCNFLTLGQYLQPSPQHLPVKEYIHPDIFNELKQAGEKMGFQSVFSGPFVRSSYMADEVFYSLKPIP